MNWDIKHLNGFDIIEKSDENGDSTFEVWLDGPNGIFFKEFGTIEEARDYVVSEADEDRRKMFDEDVDESEDPLSMDPEDIGYSHMYKFTFKQSFEAKKFFDFIKKYGNGGSLLKAINDLSVGIEAECDVEEWILTVLNQSAQKRVTVITISEKLPCIDEWEAIAKAFHAKLKYESLDDEQREKQVFVQGNVNECNKEEETNMEESRKPKDKRVYAEIYSYVIPSHITWFDNLKVAKKSLEDHIASMTKVGDYEIFRDEKAADVKMQEGDVEITLYVPSGSEDVVDNDVEHVIIRPKKEEPSKDETNKMKNESLIDDESHNIELSSDKASDFIKESVEWLLQQEMGCCTKELTPEVQLAVGWIDGYDPEDPNLIHSKEDPTWCICVGIVAADGDDMKTDLEWLTIPYVADGENEGDVFSELMEPLSPNDNYAKVFEYLAKEYEGILKEYDVHSDGKCFHKKGNAATEESIKPKKGKGGLTFKEKCRAAQRGFKYAPDLDYLMYEDEDMVIASDEAHIPSWDVLNSGDYDLYGREVTEDDTYLGDGDIPTLMDSMLYDGPWEKFTIRNGHLVGREPTDEQPA